MKKILPIICLLLLLCSCSPSAEPAQVAATTLPVYEFTASICDGTGIRVTRLITENVSCLHDYTLQVSQMRAIEGAQVTVISGAGLEDFLEDALVSADTVIDASEGISLLHPEHTHHDGEHHHEDDPHYWLSPVNAIEMAQNICTGLSKVFPQHAEQFSENCTELEAQLLALAEYGQDTLSELSCRELVTFHDGFSYFADAFDLSIPEAVEEESGSEASASELISLTTLVQQHRLPAIFTETNGSTAAASIIAKETGVQVFTLDMAMAGDSYFDAMYHNIRTIKEALG